MPYLLLFAFFRRFKRSRRRTVFAFPDSANTNACQSSEIVSAAEASTASISDDYQSQNLITIRLIDKHYPGIPVGSAEITVDDAR